MAQSDSIQPRHRFGRILWIVLAVLLLLPVLAILAMVALFDANAAKPQIVAALEAATGRTIVLTGPIRLVPGLHPGIELNDVALSNPPGFSRPHMAVLKRLDLQVALLPLLSRRVEVDRLAIDGADLLLELNSAGERNWHFAPHPVADRAAPPSSAIAPAPGGAHPMAIHVSQIELTNSRLGYRNFRMAAPTTLSVRTFDLAADAPDAPVRLSMAGSADGVPVTVSGRIGPYDALLGAALPVNLDLALTAAEAKLSLAGSIRDPVRLSGADLRLHADIPDLAALSGFSKTGLPALKGITAETRLTDLPDKPGLLLSGFTLQDLKLALPQAQLDGEIAVTLGPPPSIKGSLHAARIDVDALRALLPVAGSAQPGGGGPAPAPKPQPSPQRLFSDQDIPLGFLQGFDADLAVTIAALIQGGVTYRDLAGQIAVHKAALRIAPFTVTVPGGPVKFTLAIDAGQPTPPVALTLSAPSVALARFLAAFALPAYAQGNLWVNADLHGTGHSLHQIAATLDGSLGLSMENAQIDSHLLGQALNVLETLKNAKSGFTVMRCLAVRLNARNGNGTLGALLLDTAPVRVSGRGGLDLDKETLAIRLHAAVRVGDAGIAAPLDLRGTFLAPKLSIDPTAPVAIAGGVAAAPFGIVIGQLGGKLGLDKLGLNQPGEGESCPQAVAIAHGETPASPPPAAPPSTPAPAPAERSAKPPNPADLLRQFFR